MVFRQCNDGEPMIVHGLLLRVRRLTTQAMTNISVNEKNRRREYLEKDELLGCTLVSSLLHFFYTYYIPTIIFIGCVGNILSCIVFLRTHLKTRSSSYYLAALAIVDCIFLVVLLSVWLDKGRIFNKEGFCQIIVYVSAVCSSLSVWLIIAFTIERFIAVQYPLQRLRMCTVSRAKTIVSVLVGLSLASHSYSFWIAGIIKTSDSVELCDLRFDHWEMMRIISIIDSITSLILPLILIIVINTMMMRTLRRCNIRFNDSHGVSARHASLDRSHGNLNKISGASRSPSHNSDDNTPLDSIGENQQTAHESSCRASKIISSRIRNQSSSVTPVSSTPRNVDQIPEITPRYKHVRSPLTHLVPGRNQQNITKMLLLTSTVFVLLNLPSYAIRIWECFFTLGGTDTQALTWDLQHFFMLLYYTNFSINFLLYAMYGITFRRCLKQLLYKAFQKIADYHCNPQRYIQQVARYIRAHSNAPETVIETPTREAIEFIEFQERPRRD